jgi:hypothetical protein
MDGGGWRQNPVNPATSKASETPTLEEHDFSFVRYMRGWDLGATTATDPSM